MSVTQLSATFDAVEDDTGAQIRERRARLGLSIKELAERAGVDRDTLTNLEAGGNARIQTVRSIERALSELETEPSARVQPIGDPEAGLVTFDVKGPGSGFSVVLKGPVTDLEKLEATVLRLIAGMDRPE